MKKHEHGNEKIEYHEKLSKLTGENIVDASKYKTIEQYALHIIEKKKETEKFILINLNSVIQKYFEWQRELPMVKPHYAVKCNPDPKIIKVLSCLGCHFDCATQGEIELVLQNTSQEKGKPPPIVYSNPVKKTKMVKYALDHNVNLTVFDSKEELIKLAKMSKSTQIQLLLRIKIENEESICHLSNKFGCEMKEVKMLLQLAMIFNMNVVGVCFHVGSGCKNPYSFQQALKNTYKVMKIANGLGMHTMHMVDIGGGFNGNDVQYGDIQLPNFQEIASVIRKSIQRLEKKVKDRFVKNPPLTFISEPGRFFVTEAVNVVTRVYFKKHHSEKNIQTLFIDDGIYGSFNNMLYDHQLPKPHKITTPNKQEENKEMQTVIFGQYCDGLDKMSDETTRLPSCKANDWLLWENMGAYSHTTSYHFNGFSHVPSKGYVML